VLFVGPALIRSHAPRGNAAPAAPRPSDDAYSGRGGDAERHGMHSHAERGNDQRSPKQHAPRRTGFSREAFDLPAFLLILIFMHIMHRRHPSRLGCRPNADDAEWVERHGCRESAARTWMSVRRGPTERRRSEGTPRNEGPSQEQAPLVTWGWCDFRLFQVTRRRRNPRPLGRL
jgi:hypothetical protein